MRCFKCKSDTVVKDSRPKDGTIRRRRRCLKCGNRFSTIEVLIMEQVKKPALPKHAPIRKKRNLVQKSLMPKYQIRQDAAFNIPHDSFEAATDQIIKARFEDLDFENMTDEEIEAAMEDYR